MSNYRKGPQYPAREGAKIPGNPTSRVPESGSNGGHATDSKAFPKNMSYNDYNRLLQIANTGPQYPANIGGSKMPGDPANRVSELGSIGGHVTNSTLISKSFKIPRKSENSNQTSHGNGSQERSGGNNRDSPRFSREARGAEERGFGRRGNDEGGRDRRQNSSPNRFRGGPSRRFDKSPPRPTFRQSPIRRSPRREQPFAGRGFDARGRQASERQRSPKTEHRRDDHRPRAKFGGQNSPGRQPHRRSRSPVRNFDSREIHPRNFDRSGSRRFDDEPRRRTPPRQGFGRTQRSRSPPRNSDQSWSRRVDDDRMRRSSPRPLIGRDNSPRSGRNTLNSRSRSPPRNFDSGILDRTASEMYHREGPNEGPPPRMNLSPSTQFGPNTQGTYTSSGMNFAAGPSFVRPPVDMIENFTALQSIAPLPHSFSNFVPSQNALGGEFSQTFDGQPHNLNFPPQFFPSNQNPFRSAIDGPQNLFGRSDYSNQWNMQTIIGSTQQPPGNQWNMQTQIGPLEQAPGNQWNMQTQIGPPQQPPGNQSISELLQQTLNTIREKAVALNLLPPSEAPFLQQGPPQQTFTHIPERDPIRLNDTRARCEYGTEEFRERDRSRSPQRWSNSRERWPDKDERVFGSRPRLPARHSFNEMKQNPARITSSDANPLRSFDPYPLRPSQEIFVGYWNLQILRGLPGNDVNNFFDKVLPDFEIYNLDILGMSQLPISGAGGEFPAPNRESILLYSGNDLGPGVGILLNPEARRNLLDWNSSGGDIIIARIRLEKCIMAVVQCYGPRNFPNYPKKRKKQFFTRLQDEVSKLPRNDMVVVMGDFDALINSQRKLPRVIGRYCVSTKNTNNGGRFYKFCRSNHFFIGNTWFPGKRINKVSRGFTQEDSQELSHLACTGRCKHFLLDVKNRRNTRIKKMFKNNLEHLMVAYFRFGPKNKKEFRKTKTDKLAKEMYGEGTAGGSELEESADENYGEELQADFDKGPVDEDNEEELQTDYDEDSSEGSEEESENSKHLQEAIFGLGQANSSHHFIFNRIGISPNPFVTGRNASRRKHLRVVISLYRNRACTYLTGPDADGNFVGMNSRKFIRKIAVDSDGGPGWMGVMVRIYNPKENILKRPDQIAFINAMAQLYGDYEKTLVNNAAMYFIGEGKFYQGSYKVICENITALQFIEYAIDKLNKNPPYEGGTFAFEKQADNYLFTARIQTVCEDDEVSDLRKVLVSLARENPTLPVKDWILFEVFHPKDAVDNVKAKVFHIGVDQETREKLNPGSTIDILGRSATLDITDVICLPQKGLKSWTSCPEIIEEDNVEDINDLPDNAEPIRLPKKKGETFWAEEINDLSDGDRSDGDYSDDEPFLPPDKQTKGQGKKAKKKKGKKKQLKKNKTNQPRYAGDRDMIANPSTELYHAYCNLEVMLGKQWEHKDAVYDTILPDLDIFNIDVLGVSQLPLPASSGEYKNRVKYVLFSNEGAGPGVALILSSKSRRHLVTWEAISRRIVTARIRKTISQMYMSLVHCYAPRNDEDVNSKNDFFAKLTEICQKLPKQDLIIVTGDFDATLCSSPDLPQNIVGPYTIGKETNDNGHRLIEFCRSTNLFLPDSFVDNVRAHKITYHQGEGDQLSHLAVNHNLKDYFLGVHSRLKATRFYRLHPDDCQRMMVAHFRLGPKNIRKFYIKDPVNPRACSRFQFKPGEKLKCGNELDLSLVKVVPILR